MSETDLSEKPLDPVVEEVTPDPIAESAVKVAEAKKVLAEEEARHSEVVAANTPPEPTPEVGKHILVDMSGSGTYSLLDAPKGYSGENPDRQLTIPGFGNVEHVDTDPSGVWCYRKM